MKKILIYILAGLVGCKTKDKAVIKMDCSDQSMRELSVLHYSVRLKIPEALSIVDSTAIFSPALVYHIERMNKDTSSRVFIDVSDYQIYPGTELKDSSFFKEMKAKMNETHNGELTENKTYKINGRLVNFLKYEKADSNNNVVQSNGHISFLLSKTRTVEIQLRIENNIQSDANAMLNCIFGSLDIK